MVHIIDRLSILKFFVHWSVANYQNLTSLNIPMKFYFPQNRDTSMAEFTKKNYYIIFCFIDQYNFDLFIYYFTYCRIFDFLEVILGE